MKYFNSKSFYSHCVFTLFKRCCNLTLTMRWKHSIFTRVLDTKNYSFSPLRKSATVSCSIEIEFSLIPIHIPNRNWIVHIRISINNRIRRRSLVRCKLFAKKRKSKRNFSKRRKSIDINSNHMFILRWRFSVNLLRRNRLFQ